MQGSTGTAFSKQNSTFTVHTLRNADILLQLCANASIEQKDLCLKVTVTNIPNKTKPWFPLRRIPWTKPSTCFCPRRRFRTKRFHMCTRKQKQPNKHDTKNLPPVNIERSLHYNPNVHITIRSANYEHRTRFPERRTQFTANPDNVHLYANTHIKIYTYTHIH